MDKKIKKIAVQYETSDGLVFSDEEAANKHEELLTIKKAYDDARHAWMRAITSTHKTADGYPFKITGMGNYWRLVPLYKSLSRLERVSFYVWHCDIDETDGMVIKQRDQNSGHWYSYRISELYANERCAKEALLKMQEEDLTNFTAQVEKLRKELER